MNLRGTFASVADELVSSNTVKRTMNHAAAGDVTANSYIGKGETQLRKDWQDVADFIGGQAGSRHRKSEVRLASTKSKSRTAASRTAAR